MLRRSDRRRASGRPGFTLLEVLLAMAIAVFLLAALYAAINVQLKQAQVGRATVEQATLARALLSRIANDVSATVGLCDPARFRNANNNANNASGANAAAGGATGDPNAATGGTTAGASGLDGPVTLPLGVQGTSTSLNLFVSKVPAEAWGPKPGDPGIVTSDLRCISYWMAPGGLARWEGKLVTSQDVGTLLASGGAPPGVDEAGAVLAPEVRSLELSYFDGSNWQDTWDSTTLGNDGITPIGSPRAIAIVLGVVRPASGGRPEEVKKYRHVVAIQTANGTTLLNNQQPNNGGGAAP
jgi:prepilin-type N-terminal cleavage/methylation domain-containing protein